MEGNYTVMMFRDGCAVLHCAKPSVETPLPEGGRCCSAPPHVLSPSGYHRCTSRGHSARAVSSGLSARPPAERRPSALRWHPVGDQQCQVPARTRLVVGAGSASAQRVWPSRPLAMGAQVFSVWHGAGHSSPDCSRGPSGPIAVKQPQGVWRPHLREPRW
jgi:hypothetical protein